MTVLPDTSIWVEYLRAGEKGRGRALDGLLADRRVVMVGVVAAELLTGIALPRRLEVWQMLEGLAWIELDRDGWRRVGDTSADLRSSGAATPLTDIAIAVAAVTGGADLWAEDVHFDRIARSLPGLRRFSPH